MKEMKPHHFRYYVYHGDGTFFDAFNTRVDALVWAGGPNNNYVVRKDIMGNYPDKRLNQL